MLREIDANFAQLGSDAERWRVPTYQTSIATFASGSAGSASDCGGRVGEVATIRAVTLAISHLYSSKGRTGQDRDATGAKIAFGRVRSVATERAVLASDRLAQIEDGDPQEKPGQAYPEHPEKTAVPACWP